MLEGIFFGIDSSEVYSLYQAINPFPPDQETNQEINLQLNWQCYNPNDDSLEYDIYFATATNPSIVDSNISESTYDPGELQGNTIYYWKITSKASSGARSTGPVWRFITKSIPNRPPNQPSNPSPENYLLNQNLSVQLSWECSDPDDDSLTYDIYFESNSTPSLVSSGQNINYFDPGTLENSTTYYWYIVAKDNDADSSVGPLWNFRTIPPDKIAYSRNNYIYLMNINGSSQVRLTNNNDAWEGNPSWSPDGSRIVFNFDTTEQTERTSIYTINSNGSNQVRLTDSNAREYAPCWSPDGSMIAFCRRLDFEREDIWIMNADGTGQVNLTNSPDSSESGPSWSPDGNKIAYYFWSDDNRTGDIYVMDIDGFNQQNITNTYYVDHSPNWSPDGTKIAYVGVQNYVLQIFVMDENGSNQTQLTYNDYDSIYPSWSPDGTIVVFSRKQGDETWDPYDIYIMDADGSNQARITNNDFDELGASWGIP